MRHTITLILLMFGLSFITFANEKTTSTAQQLRDARWKNRVFLLHIPEATSQEALEFKKQNEFYSKEISDRDLVIFTADNTARKKYKIRNDNFTLILIGKDGGEKERQENSVDLKKLLALIDTMPMRRKEIRSKP